MTAFYNHFFNYENIDDLIKLAKDCEIDLETFIFNQRVIKMITRALTKKRQRKAVQYFMRYVIENKEIKSKEIAKR